MSATQRAVVDDLGNINVHGRSGVVVIVKIATATDGVFENIADSDLFFEVSGKFRVALAAGVDNYQRQIILTRAQVAQLGCNHPTQFALNDETPTVARCLWAGLITSYGFRTAPTGVADVEGVAVSYPGATVTIDTTGAEDPVVIVEYVGPQGDSALQVLIDGGLLPAGSDAGDLLDLLRAPLLAGRLDFSSASNSALLGVI